MNLLYCLPLIDNWPEIYLNFILQSRSVVKSEMKMELKMVGAVNGHKFTIVGKGKGNPYE